MFILRITSFITLFLSVVFLPWPVTAFLAAIAMAAFSWFWEAVTIGILLGAIHGFSNGSEILFAFFVSSFTIVFFLEEYLKRLIEGENIVSRTVIAFSGGISFVILWLVFKTIIYYV